MKSGEDNGGRIAGSLVRHLRCSSKLQGAKPLTIYPTPLSCTAVTFAVRTAYGHQIVRGSLALSIKIHHNATHAKTQYWFSRRAQAEGDARNSQYFCVTVTAAREQRGEEGGQCAYVCIILIVQMSSVSRMPSYQDEFARAVSVTLILKQRMCDACELNLFVSAALRVP